MDPAHPFPFISNLALNLLVPLRFPDSSESYMARIKVPVGKDGAKRSDENAADQRYACWHLTEKEASMDNPIPEVYVLWHPACTVGEALARRIHGWLRPGPGLGPQVFYRSLPAPEAPAGGLPPPLPGEVRQGAPAPVVGSRVANMQIVLLLIDQHMIVDAAWRHWIGGLAFASNTPDVRVLLPVALDPTAFNVPVALGELNFLRPAGLPLPGGRQVSPEALEIVVRSLLKQLTEAFCRLMLGRLAPTAPQPQTGTGQGQSKVTIFLSHAKADGMSRRSASAITSTARRSLRPSTTRTTFRLVPPSAGSCKRMFRVCRPPR